MQLYCLTCQANYPAAPRCPQCGDRLVTPAEAQAAAAAPVVRLPALPRPTAGGRVAIGAVVALGLYLGLRDLVGATSLDAGLLAAIGLRLVGVVIGGLLAGAGRPAGASTGAAVGLVCALLFAAADFASGAAPGPVQAGVGVGLVVAATIAGMIGARMWPAPVDLPDPEPAATRGSSLARMAKQDKATRAAKPTLWLRILVGAVVVVVGVAGADVLREGLRNLIPALQIGGPAQAPTVDLQLATLVVILGGVLAGGTTGAGTRHGLLAGLLAGFGVGGLLSAGVPTLVPVAEGILILLSLPTDDPTAGGSVAAVFAVILTATTVAGWLGGQLLPPLAPKWMRSRLVPMS
jgi:hypothetical protein